MAKWLFVDVAKRDFGIEGRKQTISRVSVITVLNRKEVKRVSGLPVPDDQDSSERYNRAARVISGLSSASAQKLLEKLDSWPSKRDRDTSIAVKGTGRKIAGLGVYYFEEPYDEE